MSNIARRVGVEQGCFTGYLRGEIQQWFTVYPDCGLDVFCQESVYLYYMNKTTATFAPQLYIPNGVLNVDFYVTAFGAAELRRISNKDGTVHVAEFSIEGALFQLHEVTARSGTFDPGTHNGTTVLVGLFVSDVHSFMKRAVAAGAVEIHRHRITTMDIDRVSLKILLDIIG
jgi:PhnB protein